MSRAEDFNAKVEQATAQNFIRWYNSKYGRNLKFSHRPHNAPDFVYSDKDGKISLEVTTVHYDQGHAKAITKTARGRGKVYTTQEIIDAPELVEWHSVGGPERKLIESIIGPEKKLIESINGRLTEKCRNDYGPDCILVVRVVGAALTTKIELETEVIPQVSVPGKNLFSNIFITENQKDYFERA